MSGGGWLLYDTPGFACAICGCRPQAPVGRTSHARMHVRRGEAVRVDHEYFSPGIAFLVTERGEVEGRIVAAQRRALRAPGVLDDRAEMWERVEFAGRVDAILRGRR